MGDRAAAGDRHRLRGWVSGSSSTFEATGEYTRLTRFHPGANTRTFGGKCHAYPEEIFIICGRLYDEAFGLWLESGHYASRPPGELHGPFRTDVGCVVLEVSFPNRTDGRP